ncbi:hypothetical protein LPJ73_004468 [Coemansia sp. RSA 2703]|nr:hypothetical protein LPJ73_004468 [Coemansia sp. RSA 2703]
MTPVSSSSVSICESISSSSTAISNKHSQPIVYFEEPENLELLDDPYKSLREAAKRTVTPAALPYPSICHTIAVSDSISSNKQSPPTAYPEGLKSINLLSTPYTSLDAFSTDKMTADASPRVSIRDTIVSDATITSNVQDKPSAYLEGLKNLELLDTACAALNEVDASAIIPSGSPRVSFWDSAFNLLVDDNCVALELLGSMGQVNASAATLNATITTTKTPDITSRASVYLNASLVFVDNNLVAPELFENQEQWSTSDVFSTSTITPAEFPRVSGCDITTDGEPTTLNEQNKSITYLDEPDCLGSLDTLYTALDETTLDTVSPVKLACDLIQDNISAPIVNNGHAALELVENQKKLSASEAIDTCMGTAAESPRVPIKDSGSSSIIGSGHAVRKLIEILEKPCTLNATNTHAAVSAERSSALVYGSSTNCKSTVLIRKSRAAPTRNLLKNLKQLCTFNATDIRTTVSGEPSSAFACGTSTSCKTTVLVRKSQAAAYRKLLKSQGFIVTA